MNYECEGQYLEAMGAEAEAEAEANHYADLHEYESHTVNYNELCGMTKFKDYLLHQVAIEVNSGTYNMPQILLLIERVYNDFNFEDLHGTCKVGDYGKPVDVKVESQTEVKKDDNILPF